MCNYQPGQREMVNLVKHQSISMYKLCSYYFVLCRHLGLHVQVDIKSLEVDRLITGSHIEY